MTCFVLRDVLSAADCDSLLRQCDSHGWHPAALEFALGEHDHAGEAIINQRLRDSDRCIVFDSELADRLWMRLQPLIPATAFEPLRPQGVNPCFRCLRYSEGQAGFAKHADGSSVVDGRLSRLTVQLYLNHGFEGGATRLCVVDDVEDRARGIDVMPLTGMAFVFDQRLLHSGRPVSRGIKYSARTEIMYS